MTVLRRDTGSAVTSAGATTLSPVVPAGARDGDILELVINVRTGVAQTFGGLTGWTQKFNLSVISPVLAVFYKKCNGDAGATVSPTWQTSAACSAFIVAHTGVDWDNDPFAGQSSDSSAASATVKFGTRNPLVGDSLTVAVAAADGTTAITGPSGYTSILSNITNASLRMWQEALDPARDALAESNNGSVTAVNNQGCTYTLRPALLPGIRSALAAATITSGTSSVAVAQPAGTQKGDILIAVCGITGDAAKTWNTPTGWTLLDQVNGKAIFYRTAAAHGSGTTHTFSTNVNVGASGATITVKAYHSVSAVSASATRFTGTTPAFPAVTGPGLWVGIGAFFTSTAQTEPSTDAAFTQDEPTSSGTYYFWHTPYQGAGSSGTQTITLGTSQATQSIVASFMLSPVAAPWIRQVELSYLSSGTTLTVQLPDQVQAGDRMVMFVQHGATGATFTTPTGWSIVSGPHDSRVASPDATFIVYEKIAEAADTGGATASLVTSASDFITATVVAIPQGVIDAHQYNNAQDEVLPTFTTTKPNELLVYWHAGFSVASIDTTVHPDGLFRVSLGVGGTATQPVWIAAQQAANDTGPGSTFSESGVNWTYGIGVYKKKSQSQMVV